MMTPLILPFVVWGAAIGVTALLGLGGYALFSEGEDPEKNRLGILGMQWAGKTKFLSFLRGVPYVEKQTSIEHYKPFTYRYGEKVIPIDAGLDIGGGNMFRGEYNRILENSNVIFYFFDISRYLNDDSTEGVSYRRACNSRIEHIHSGKKGKNTSVVYIGTHIDKCKKDEAKVRSEFFKLIDDKYYYSDLKKTEFINLTNTNQLRNFINKVFK